MDLETGVKLAQLGFMVAQAVVLVFMLLMRGTFATKKDAGTAHAHADNAHHRLDLLEQRVAQQPTDEDVKGLRDVISSLGADMRENSVRVETAVLGVKRIEDWLMRDKK